MCIYIYFLLCKKNNFAVGIYMNLLSWAKDMNVSHSFSENLYKRTVLEAKLRGIFIFRFFCFTQFTLFLYKSLIIIVVIFQKYQWIQHKKSQPASETNYYEWVKRLYLFWFSKKELYFMDIFWDIYIVCDLWYIMAKVLFVG